MAEDFGSMVARIRVDLNRGTAHDTRIKQAIADAIKFYVNRRFGFNQKRAETQVLQGDEFVALPTDWLEVDSLRREQDGLQRKKLDEVNYDLLETKQDGTVIGPPTQYAIENRELRLYPICDRSYSLMMSLLFEWKNISEAAADAETNPWVTEGAELIRKHAMGDLLVSYVSDPDAVARGELLLKECSDKIAVALESRAAREQTAGKIQPSL